MTFTTIPSYYFDWEKDETRGRPARRERGTIWRKTCEAGLTAKNSTTWPS